VPKLYSIVRGDIPTPNNIHSTTIRKFLIKTGLKAPICEGCELTKWRDRLIPLQLHHVDGNNKNNVLSNLQLLCPNCHAQTPGWSTNIATKPVSDHSLFEKLVETKGNIHITIKESGMSYTRKTRHRIHDIAAKNNTTVDAVKSGAFTQEPRVTLADLWG
jgi:hypothetical protein